MTEKRFQIIHLGNPYDFVVKDHRTNKTYGTLQGDDKSLQECLDNIVEENEQLKQQNEQLQREINIKDDLIQQLRNTAFTDYYKESEKYRKKCMRLFEELAEDEMMIGNLKDEIEDLKRQLND